jgi:hypothetical protein
VAKTTCGAKHAYVPTLEKPSFGDDLVDGQRLYRHELLKDEEIEFAKLMENKYPGEYECSKHIAEYIEKEYGGQISGEEIMFLAIHIKRVCMTD